MLILPIHTPVLTKGDDLAAILRDNAQLQPGDILVVSSKAAATTEGAGYRLSEFTPSAEAAAYARRWNIDPLFCEATLQETARMHGRIASACPGFLFSELRPDGMTRGVILAAFAGLDLSNVPDGLAIGWPTDCIATVRALHAALGAPVILTDSCCAIRRLGVTAHALTVAGMDPLHSEIGKPDLFGRSMRVTQEAIADQLATAANIVMGNAAQSCPAAIIRDHGCAASGFVGWVPGIEPEQDIFRGLTDDAALPSNG